MKVPFTCCDIEFIKKMKSKKKKKNEEEERNMIWHTLFYIICYIYIFFDELGKYLLKSTV